MEKMRKGKWAMAKRGRKRKERIKRRIDKEQRREGREKSNKE